MMRKLVTVCVVAGLLGVAGTCFADVGDHTWIGVADNNWNNPDNWDLGTVPNIGQRAFCQPPLAGLVPPTLAAGDYAEVFKLMSDTPGSPEAECHIYGEMQIQQAIFWPDSGGCFPTLYTHAGGEIHQGHDLELGWGASGGTYIMEGPTKGLPGALHTAESIQAPGKALWGHITMEGGILHQYAHSDPIAWLLGPDFDRKNDFEIGESMGDYGGDPLDSYIRMAPGALLRINGAFPELLAYRTAQIEGYIADGRLCPVSLKGGLYIEYEVIEDEAQGGPLLYTDKWRNTSYDVYPYIEVRCVPEPATLSLLGSLLVLGGVAFLCRRRS